jgi:hypothetical protein
MPDLFFGDYEDAGNGAALGRIRLPAGRAECTVVTEQYASSSTSTHAWPGDV